MQSSTFDVKEWRKRIIVFKVGKLWLFKHFFEDKEIFKALLAYYNQDAYRFEFKTIADRNNALKILEAERLRLRPGRGPAGLRRKAPQVRQVCADPEELRGH